MCRRSDQPVILLILVVLTQQLLCVSTGFRVETDDDKDVLNQVESLLNDGEQTARFRRDTDRGVTMTKKPTDKVNYIVDAYGYREFFHTKYDVYLEKQLRKPYFPHSVTDLQTNSRRGCCKRGGCIVLLARCEFHFLREHENLVQHPSNNISIDKANFDILQKIETIEANMNSMKGSSSVDQKIDNISTFLLRMNNKIDTLARERGGRQSSAMLETLAQESYDMITLLPTYIENTRAAILALGNDTKNQFREVESLLVDDTADGGKQSLKTVLKSTEDNILQASSELKQIVVESGNMAESLFERVDSGYKELEKEIQGLANVEKVLIDTADSVMDTKRKIEFGVQQIIFKVTELIELSGGEMDDNLASKFESITKTILANQTEALTNLTSKVEKEIGQVWRQLGIMYGQLSSSIGILEKVKDQTEIYVSKTDKNLGSMDNQVEGLTDRMSEVDNNLNYMLGQLSLVVQEFNQVKTGLGEAMNGIGDDLLEKKTNDEN